MFHSSRRAPRSGMSPRSSRLVTRADGTRAPARARPFTKNLQSGSHPFGPGRYASDWPGRAAEGIPMPAPKSEDPAHGHSFRLYLNIWNLVMILIGVGLVLLLRPTLN